MSVPVGFPGEQRNTSLIKGSASIAFFICLGGNHLNTFQLSRNKILIHRRPSPKSAPSLRPLLLLQPTPAHISQG